MLCGVVTRDDLKVIKAKLDADGFAHVPFALQVACNLFAQAGKYFAQLGLVFDGVQVALERGFAAHADGLALGHYRSVILAVGGGVQPGSRAFAKGSLQPLRLAGCELPNRLNAMQLELGVSLGANAVDLAAGQRPDQALQIGFMHDGNAVGLVELAGHFGQQFVGRHADRAGQAGIVKNRFLDQSRQHPTAFALATGHLGKVDVHLIHPPVFHDRRDLGNDRFESLRIVPVLCKVHRQQNRLRTEFGGLHEPHR